MSPVLIEVVELFEFVCMHHDVQTAHLRQTEFLVLHARKAHLQQRDLITHHYRGPPLLYLNLTEMCFKGKKNRKDAINSEQILGYSLLSS